MKEHLEGRFYEIDCVFQVRDGEPQGERAARSAIERIRAEAEDAVRQGYNHLILTDERISSDLAAMPMILATGAVHSHLVRRGSAHLHLDQCARGGMSRHALFRGADRRRRHDGERLSRAGMHRRPPCARTVRQAFAGRRA